MDDLEAIKQRKMQQLQDQMAAQQEQTDQIQGAVAKLESLVKSHLTPEARSRLTNIKISNPEKHMQLLQLLGYLIQNGQLQGRQLDDSALKDLLVRVNQKSKRDIKIRRV